MQKNLIFLRDSFNRLDAKWQDILETYCVDNLISIDKQLQNIALQNIIYPPQDLIFNALQHTKFDNIKVVILGQDPYHGENEANGLAFAVNKGIAKPPSLRNIYTELLREYADVVAAQDSPLTTTQSIPNDLLLSWANQGVLLLNATLTVIKDKPNSLANIGWGLVTDKIISVISQELQHVVFILWGSFAKGKAPLIDESKHLILTSAHPSPLSAHRGFMGCNHFVFANRYLIQSGKSIIKWLCA